MRILRVFSFLFFALGVPLAMAVEEAKYHVLQADEPFELRQYQSQVLAETLVEGRFDKAGNAAFGRLFRYISGENTRRISLAMTAPVEQRSAGQEIAMTAPVGQQKREDQWAVSFMLPADLSLQTAPKPGDPKVQIREVPARRMACVRYSGFWSQKAYEKNLSRLRAWMLEQGLVAAGEPIWARYDPPFKPWFLRRNEILIPLAD